MRVKTGPDRDEMLQRTIMNDPLTVSALATSVWRDFRKARRPLFIWEAAFKVTQAWLFIPAIAAILAAVLAGAGHVAVSNTDILDFLLTPSGLLYAALLGTLWVAILLFEQAGIMLIAAFAGTSGWQLVMQIRRAFLAKAWRIAQLGALQAAWMALALAPFVLLSILTYRILLSGHDINFYLEERPTVFWVAVGIGVFLIFAALVIACWLYVRWSLALPILLFEQQSARDSLRASRERVRGAGGRVAMNLLGLLLGASLLGVALEAGFRLFAATVLANAGERPFVVILLLLTAQGGLLAIWSYVLNVGHGLLIRRLYVARSESVGVIHSTGWAPTPGAEKPAPAWNWRFALLWLPIFLLAPLAVWFELSRQLPERPLVRVTAHRGHAVAAPENTLSSVRKAIESGADYAEVDVVLTADGVPVLLHDRDLMRVAGDRRRIEDLRYDEVRQIDVGSWFDASFAGERIPTLVEVIALARGRIRLNLELKFFGPDRQLAQDVARIVREQQFESECLVTSFALDALQDVKRVNPPLRTGLIVAHALGDVSRIDVEALSVRADFLSDDLLRGAHRQGREVHVWAIGDDRQMIRLIERGVDNIITDDPDRAIRIRDHNANMTESERLLLVSRLLLGLNP
jgi:glycerophosphoryl diester phosphodiesterase